MPAAPECVHGTAISVDGAAILIRGASGSGKSDLALRCLALGASGLLPGPAQLIADDQVLLSVAGRVIRLACPTNIAGKIEVRGLGILDVASVEGSVLHLIADISPAEEIERMPVFPAVVTILGVDVPHIRIAPFEALCAYKAVAGFAAVGIAAGLKLYRD